MNTTWTTISSHPASGIAYQEKADGTLARVTENGHEVVSPSRNTDSVWKQYHGRVQRAITDLTGE